MLRQDHCFHGVTMLHVTSWDMVDPEKDLFQGTGCLLYKETFG